MGRISRCFLAGLALVLTLSMIGCGGGGGGGDGGGTGTTSRQVAQSYDEQCVFCHGAGASQAVAVVHSIALGSPKVTVIAVREVPVGAGDDRLEVDVKIVDSATNAPIYIDPSDTSNNGTGRLRFTLAKLIPATGGNASKWQSYINSGTAPAIVATSQRANAAGGVFTVLATPGEYRYRFSFNMNSIPASISPIPVSYDKANTHRIATQFTANVDNDKSFADFVPNNLPWSSASPAPAVNRKISANGSATTSCNSCHVRLGFHGGDRIRVEYCVTCHNPGSTDPDSGNTVDFKVMIHKFHRGENLPSVEAGGIYEVAGADYSTVAYPQDIRNCTKCHTNSTATPQGDNWKNVPTIEACGSCHDRTSFVDPPPAGFTPHSGGVPVSNADCTSCHNPGDVDIATAHVIPTQAAAGKFQYNIISITNTAPGQFPTVKFSVTNPTAGNAPYNIRTAPEFRSPARLAILISWDTKDYTNTGSRVTPAQPISINPVSGAVNNGDGTFTVASTVPIPAGVTSGAVAIEGHPAVETVPGSGIYDLQVPVTGVVKSFPAGTPDRRTVVDFATRCKQCHEVLSLHGGNRNNNTQLCVICHNANATDINRRTGTGVDGKAEEAIDFKTMIHGIHAAKAGTDLHGFRTNGIVVYGFGGSVNDFSHVRMPTGAGASSLNRNLNLRNCLGCHIDPAGAPPPTNELPSADALPTTIKTGSDRSSPDDDENITPTAAVCSACHDDTATKTHMTANGGRFDYKAYITVVEGGGGGSDQAALCGPGPVSSQPAGHTARTDCCSCHSPR